MLLLQLKKLDHGESCLTGGRQGKGNRLGCQEPHISGEVSEGSLLKKKLGITERRIREVRKALSVLKVDTKG